MVIEENTKDGRIRHYSDRAMKIRQIETGNVYEDAVDVVPCRFTYEETDVPCDSVELDPQEALDMLFGGDAE